MKKESPEQLDNEVGNRFTKKFYKVREVVEIIGLPASTLRFWESEFKELRPKRSPHNQRLYTPRDIETLEIINFLLNTKGLKIEAAKENLRDNRGNLSRKMEVISKLKEARADLETLLKSLNLRGEKIGLNFEV